MDFTLTFSPEMENFRAEVGAWLDEHDPKMPNSSDPIDYTPEDDVKRNAFRKALADKGWLFPTGPKAYGGGGLTGEHAFVLTQELDRRAIYYAGGGESSNPITCTLVYGTEEQKRQFAGPLLRGELAAWHLLTEPQGGSDLASARTTAILDGDDYVVNGQKTFVGNRARPDLLFTIVNTDPNGARHRNLSYLMIPTNSPGVTIQPFKLLSSTTTFADRMAESNKNHVFFDDVRVPVANLIGGHNEGWKVAATDMELEHGGGGNIRRDLNVERLLQAVQTYEWDGKRLLDDAETREIVSELFAQREIQRLFGARNYWMVHSKIPAEHGGPQASYWLKSRAHDFAQHLQDALGHYAVQRDPRYMVGDGFIELFARSCYVTVHGAGGLNIQATIVARRLAIGRNTREEAGRLE